MKTPGNISLHLMIQATKYDYKSASGMEMQKLTFIFIQLTVDLDGKTLERIFYSLIKRKNINF